MFNVFHMIRERIKSMTSEPLASEAFVRSTCESTTDEALLRLCAGLGMNIRKTCEAFLATCPQSKIDQYFLTLNTAGDYDRRVEPLPEPRTLGELVKAAVAYGKKYANVSFAPPIEKLDKSFWVEVNQRCQRMSRLEKDQTYNDLRRMMAGQITKLSPLPPAPPIKTLEELDRESKTAAEQARECREATERELCRIQGRVYRPGEVLSPATIGGGQ